MLDTNEHLAWYQRSGFVVAALIIIWPIGAALMWRQRKFTYPTRVRVTTLAAVLTLLVVMAVLPPLHGSIGMPPDLGAASQDAAT